MQEKDFCDISMNGRMAYLILCVESYIKTKYPSKDWTVLSKWMWKSTSEYWDEWDDKFMEIIPEFLFEFDSYEESDFENLTKEEYDYFTDLFKDLPEDFNSLLLKLHEMNSIYCYEPIPGQGEGASKLIIESCAILKKYNIPLPAISTVAFSSFSEKNGWGENFDGTKLSIILN